MSALQHELLAACAADPESVASRLEGLRPEPRTAALIVLSQELSDACLPGLLEALPPSNQLSSVLLVAWAEELRARLGVQVLAVNLGRLGGAPLAHLIDLELGAGRTDEALILLGGFPKEQASARGLAGTRVGLALHQQGHKKAQATLTAAVKAASTGDSFAAFSLAGQLEPMLELGPEHPAVNLLVDRLEKVSQKYVKGDGNSYAVHRALRTCCRACLAGRAEWLPLARRLTTVYSDHLRLATQIWLTRAEAATGGQGDEGPWPELVSVGDWVTGVLGLPSPDDEVLLALEGAPSRVLQRVVAGATALRHAKTLAVLGRRYGQREWVEQALGWVGPRSSGAIDVCGALAAQGDLEQALALMATLTGHQSHARAQIIEALLAGGGWERALDLALEERLLCSLGRVCRGADSPTRWQHALGVCEQTAPAPQVSAAMFAYEQLKAAQGLADSLAAGRPGPAEIERLASWGAGLVGNYPRESAVSHLAGRAEAGARAAILSRLLA